MKHAGTDFPRFLVRFPMQPHGAYQSSFKQTHCFWGGGRLLLSLHQICLLSREDDEKCPITGSGDIQNAAVSIFFFFFFFSLSSLVCTPPTVNLPVVLFWFVCLLICLFNISSAVLSAAGATTDVTSARHTLDDFHISEIQNSI